MWGHPHSYCPKHCWLILQTCSRTRWSGLWRTGIDMSRFPLIHPRWGHPKGFIFRLCLECLSANSFPPRCLEEGVEKATRRIRTPEGQEKTVHFFQGVSQQESFYSVNIGPLDLSAHLQSFSDHLLWFMWDKGNIQTELLKGTTVLFCRTYTKVFG